MLKVRFDVDKENVHTPLKKIGRSPIKKAGLTPMMKTGLTPLKKSGMNSIKNAGFTPLNKKNALKDITNSTKKVLGKSSLKESLVEIEYAPKKPSAVEDSRMKLIDVDHLLKPDLVFQSSIQLLDLLENRDEELLKEFEEDVGTGVDKQDELNFDLPF